MRNRIIHGFRVTSKDGKQIIATKERAKDNVEEKQYYIDEAYLEKFINLNSELSILLHELRGF